MLASKAHSLVLARAVHDSMRATGNRAMSLPLLKIRLVQFVMRWVAEHSLIPLSSRPIRREYPLGRRV